MFSRGGISDAPLLTLPYSAWLEIRCRLLTGIQGSRDSSCCVSCMLNFVDALHELVLSCLVMSGQVLSTRRVNGPRASSHETLRQNADYTMRGILTTATRATRASYSKSSSPKMAEMLLIGSSHLYHPCHLL